MVAIVFGHKIHIFIPKFGQNSIFIPKSAWGWRGSIGLGIIHKKKTVFFTASLKSFACLDVEKLRKEQQQCLQSRLLIFEPICVIQCCAARCWIGGFAFSLHSSPQFRQYPLSPPVQQIDNKWRLFIRNNNIPLIHNFRVSQNRKSQKLAVRRIWYNKSSRHSM